jgi:hypothetical protein
MSYDVETSSSHEDSSSGFSAFPPRPRHTPAIIATLVAHDRHPTSNNIEFVGMVGGGGDLIFETLCTDSDPSPPRSNNE